MISQLKAALRSKPKGLYVLLCAEIPELFGRFGIMATIALYLTQSLHTSDQVAFETLGTYLMLSCITPILGGYLADRFLTHQRAIILGAIIMMVGNGLLVCPHLHIIYLGLVIVAIGFGFFSPSLAAMLSSLYHKEDEDRENAFVLYYICRNVGALLAPTLCGVVGVLYGYHYAFIMTAAAMLLGLLVFIRGLKHLPAVALSATDRGRSLSLGKKMGQCLERSPLFFNVLLSLLLIPLGYLVFIFHLSADVVMVGALIVGLIFFRLFQLASREQRRHLVYILLSIAAVTVFFSLNHLCGASFNLFVERIIDRHYFGVLIPTSVFYSFDPLVMIVFGYSIMAFVNKIKKPNAIAVAFKKYTMALLIFSLAMWVFVVAGQQAIHGGSASGGYVMVCYALCAISELCIVPIVIALVTKLAPAGKVALMMGLYQFGDAIASFLTGKIAEMGAINFPLNSLQALEHAALIYRNLFFELAVVLLVAAMLVGGIFLGVKRMTAMEPVA